MSFNLSPKTWALKKIERQESEKYIYSSLSEKREKLEPYTLILKVFRSCPVLRIWSRPPFVKITSETLFVLMKAGGNFVKNRINYLTLLILRNSLYFLKKSIARIFSIQIHKVIHFVITIDLFIFIIIIRMKYDGELRCNNPIMFLFCSYNRLSNYNLNMKENYIIPLSFFSIFIVLTFDIISSITLNIQFIFFFI